jgi:UTP-glucose-1-phosphate uridylyltransferase
MKPTLVILAAGMGSRYGGLKQLDGMGPKGETILEYSIYDAIRAGFGKVVFIIRESFENEFKEKVISKFQNKIQTEIVFQKLDEVPATFVVPSERENPWGTGQAVLAAAPKVNEPFAVINADDFYGREAFELMAKMLRERAEKTTEWVMIAYKLGNTLSKNGSVSRGVCSLNVDSTLKDIVEHTQIIYSKENPISISDKKETPLSFETSVSMNFFGFTPDVFSWLKAQFTDFLKVHIKENKSEFYLPAAVNQAIIDEHAKVTVKQTNAKWIGVTYPEDKNNACKEIDELVKLDYYPLGLW